LTGKFILNTRYEKKTVNPNTFNQITSNMEIFVREFFFSPLHPPK